MGWWERRRLEVDTVSEARMVGVCRCARPSVICHVCFCAYRQQTLHSGSCGVARWKACAASHAVLSNTVCCKSCHNTQCVFVVGLVVGLWSVFCSLWGGLWLVLGNGVNSTSMCDGAGVFVVGALMMKPCCSGLASRPQVGCTRHALCMTSDAAIA